MNHISAADGGGNIPDTWRQRLLLLAILVAMGGLSSATAERVGRIAGDFSVTPSGAVSYQIPIFTAAGQNGLQPSVALVYNSRAGDGFAGWGWSIAGFSQIARCGLIAARDGEFQGVRYTGDDRFCLDGAPLIAVQGQYGADGTKYRTEIHNYEDITSIGTVGTDDGAGPEQFEVKLRNGLTYRYGINDNTRIEAADNPSLQSYNPDGAIRMWMLAEIADTYNTRIIFKYAENVNNGVLRPSEILWTVPDQQPESVARYRLKLNYDPRPAAAKRDGYVWGAIWTRNRRLVSIDYQFKDQSAFANVHRYYLTYKSPSATGSQRDQLESIRQCGPNGAAPTWDDCLPPTSLAWLDAVGGWSTNEDSGPSIGNQDAAFADYDGDGDTDLFVPDNGDWQLLLADDSADSFAAPIDTNIAHNGPAFPFEYNGDGLTDFLVQRSGTNSWRVYQSTETGSPSAKQIINLTADDSIPAFSDIDGDGLDDMVYIKEGSPDCVKFRRNSGSSIGGEEAAGVCAGANEDLSAILPNDGSLQRTDYDGDGRDDLLMKRFEVATTFYSAFAADDGPPVYVASDQLSASGGQVTVDGAIALDVNGDGNSDLLACCGTSGGWAVNISLGGRPQSTGTGIGFYRPTCSQAIPNAGEIIVVDYDHDGRDDLLREHNNGWRAHLSDGVCYYDNITTHPQYVKDIGGPDPATVDKAVAADLNGDGNRDLLFGLNNGTWKIRRHNGPDSRGDLVQVFIDGLGVAHTPVCEPLALMSDYTADATVSFPAERLIRGGPIYAVDKVGISTGQGGGFFELDYEYWNAKRDMQGRGFLGFEKVKTTDSRTLQNVETTYVQAFPHIGVVDQAVRKLSGGSKLSDYDPTWDVEPDLGQGSGEYFVFLDEETTIEYEADVDGGSLGSVVRTTDRDLTYDFEDPQSLTDHGAVANELITLSGASGITHTTDIDTTYWSGFAATNRCLGFPERIDVTKTDTSPNQATITRTRQYTYDTNTCRRTTETIGPAGAAQAQLEQQLVIVLGYDADGKLETVTRKSADPNAQEAPRVTSIGWDTATKGGYRPISQTFVIDNQTDLVVGMDWDYGLGLQKSQTDPRGNTTSWNYDEFGRLELETRPGNSTTTITYSVCSSCFAPNAEYKIRADDSDDFWTESYHDMYGRQVGAAQVVLSDTGTTEGRRAIGHNSLGQKVSETVPYLVGDSQFTATFTYDPIGRIKTAVRPSEQLGNATMSYVYRLLSTDITDAEGRPSTFNFDLERRLIGAFGNTGAPLDERSSGIYAYWPHGELKTVLNAGIQTTSMTYDDRGFLATVDDKDSGLWTYDFNVFGELISQTDDQPTQNVMTQKFDQLARIKERNEPEGLTTWVYHQSGTGLGLLDIVTGPSSTGFSEAYAYDTLGFVQDVDRTIDALTYRTTYDFDANSHLLSVIYPPTRPGFQPKASYSYNKGYIETVTFEDGMNPARQIYEVQTHDALGRETLSTYGSGSNLVDSQQVFDRGNLRLTNIVTGAASLGSDIQDYTYQWDKVGNLKLREDRGQPGSTTVTETFDYDGLNRVDKAYLDSVLTLDVDYASNGNIVSKSDVGTYAYTGDGPHAVSSITDFETPPNVTDYHYDANGNMDCRGGTDSTCTGGDRITWYSFNKPNLIEFGQNWSTFEYGADRQRIQQSAKLGSITRILKYVGDHFQIEDEPSTTRWRTTIFANGKPIYLHVENQTCGCSCSGGEESYFIHLDHLGSIDQLYSDSFLGSDKSYSYDSFGKRREPIGWAADDDESLLDLYDFAKRGYTGHEHLDNVRLIHMNGRVQDPISGRMLSPDPVLGVLQSPQTLNPYSYVANNPLSMVDPTGLFGITISCSFAVTNPETGEGFLSCDTDVQGVPTGIGGSGGTGIPGIGGTNSTFPDIFGQQGPGLNFVAVAGIPVGIKVLGAIAVAAGVAVVATDEFGNTTYEMADWEVIQGRINEMLGNVQMIGAKGIVVFSPVDDLTGGSGGPTPDPDDEEFTVGTSVTSVQLSQDDLVLGPSAGGKLRQLQQATGGRTVTDLPNPTAMGMQQRSLEAIRSTLTKGHRVVFDLSNVENLQGVLRGVGPHSNTVTAAELRFLREVSSGFRSQITFINNGRVVKAPF